MKTVLFTTLLLLIHITVVSQSEEAAIREALQSYIDGSSYNDPEKIEAPFYEDARMFLSKKDQPIWILSPKEYADRFKKREKGKFNGRVGTILSVDQSHDIATAKVEISIDEGNMIFMDLFILKKLEGAWKIISKAATRMPDEK